MTMGLFGWLALLAVLLVLATLYFSFRRNRIERAVLPPAPNFEVSEELGVQLDSHLVEPTGEPWLPRGYGENRMELLVRDPRCLYAYWEFPAELLDDEQRSGLHLRLGQLDGADVDYSIGELVGSWYFTGVKPGCHFTVSLGYFCSGRTFVEVMRSKTVMTPPDYPSSVIAGDYIPGLWDKSGEYTSSPLWWQGGQS